MSGGERFVLVESRASSVPVYPMEMFFVYQAALVFFGLLGR